jgi:hypothetical protein
VEKLLRLKELLAQGMSISQAAEQVRLGVAPPPVPASSEVERVRQGLSQALSRFDAAGANRVLGEAMACFTVEQLVLSILRPMLPELSPFGRTYLRSKLGGMLAASPQTGGRTALVLNPDPCDLEPLLAALLLSRRGHDVIYIEGTEPPEGLTPDLLIDPRRWDRLPMDV